MLSSEATVLSSEVPVLSSEVVFGTSLIRHTARSSAADRLWMRTLGATAGRRTRQTMVDEEVVDPEAAARSTDYLISRSFARRLPSFLPVLHVRWRPLSHRPSLISPCVVFETNPALFAFSNHNQTITRYQRKFQSRFPQFLPEQLRRRSPGYHHPASAEISTSKITFL